MRVAKAVAAVALLLIFQCVGVVAQEELDLEALLEDLTEPVAEEQVAEVSADVEEPVEVDEIIMEEVAEDVMFEDLMIEVAEEPETLEEAPAAEVLEAEVEALLEEEPAEIEVAPEELMEEMVEEADDEMIAEAGAADEEVDAAAEAAVAFAAQEEIRRQAMEIEGLKGLEQGFKALERKEYEEAAKHFGDALKSIPARRATMADRERAKWGLAEAEYTLAATIYKAKDGDLSEARRHVERALAQMPDHRAAMALARKIDRKEERQTVLAAIPTPAKERDYVIERKQTVESLLAEGKDFYEIGDYNAAEARFDKVLLEDEFNTDAMRFLKKMEDKKYRISSTEREATVAEAMRRVRDTWNPPIMEEVELPDDVRIGGTIETKTAASDLREKMAKIMIPSIEFRHANIRDVVNFLVEASIAGDPDGHGVNIILNLNLPQGNGGVEPVQQPSADADFFDEMDQFGDFFEDTPAESRATDGSSAMIPTITLNLRRISLLESMKIITEVAGLRFRIEGNVVIITPAGYATGTVMTRLYPVQPSILDVIIEREEEDERTGEFIEMGGARTSIKRGDVKEFFQKAGVPFPIRTSITYNPGSSQLIVANTPENLEIFERILAQLNVIPHQVEIEARFVEIAQTDMEEIGFEWILRDNWEIAYRDNNVPMASQERIQVDADNDGFTQGLRFFGIDSTTGARQPSSSNARGVGVSPIGGILSISSILTNPQLTMILHALDQSGGADLLSAPRVTTRSGVNAQIEVVREIIYPTEFEVTQPTIQSEGNLVTPPTVTPGGFETRETGVILNVTPTVGPDGYTIDLTMIPEVSELVDWIEYGSEITLATAGGNQTFRFNIPQPVFSSRNVTTSIVIWDGQTVVMGGLIREDLVTVSDKIPLLGDIPILGRLFRTEAEHSQKHNLLIFVTARLVDPAGKPIHRADVLPGGAVSAE